jgi:uncharacterized heparinase superfamily protein
MNLDKPVEDPILPFADSLPTKRWLSDMSARAGTPEPARPPLTSIDELLAIHHKVNGEFSYAAEVAQYLKTLMHGSLNWERLTPVQREALEQLATRLARILSGDPDDKKNYVDIQIYARLVEKSLA